MTSASCSICPVSLKSDKSGRLSCRDSTERDNCDNATTQTFNSRANNLSLREISLIS